MNASKGTTLARGVLFALTGLCAAIAVLGFGLALYLVDLGANPADGHGSLGHVGIVFAGLISGFLAVVAALFGVYFFKRTRRGKAEQQSAD